MEATQTEHILVQRDVPVPMRDGTRLAADIYRLESDEPRPVVLCRLPYGKRMLRMQNFAAEALRTAEAGYVVVYQDSRGRFASEGDFYPFHHEAEDGYDTVEWCAAQPWSNGVVGMTGGSYFGATQWLAATLQPPHLKALCPSVTSADYHEGWTYRGGAFHLGFALQWTLSALAPETSLRLARSGRGSRERLSQLQAAIDRVRELYGVMPLTSMAELRGVADYYYDWIEHEQSDAYWRRWRIADQYEKVQVPALNVGGWYDLFIGGTIDNFTGMRAQGGSEAARNGGQLLIGPWAHGLTTGEYAEHAHGIMADLALIDLTGTQIRFFDRWLKGIDNGVDRRPPVRVFVMGENVWRDEQEWPLARAAVTPYYLHSHGHANTLNGDGVLSTEPPASEPPDVYLYDPRNPVPTVGGATFLPGLFIAANTGPRDQRGVEQRSDVLVYSTPSLEQDVEVTGPVSVRLFAVTSAADTDWTAKLVDVHPSGFARILCDGIIRARYREGTDEARPIEPNRPYEYAIDLWATSNLFRAGHRIRVEISSSNFPRWDRNPNTGHKLGVDSLEDVRPALQTILHDAEHPSQIRLPIVPR